jgi:hypothetical protein
MRSVLRRVFVAFLALDIAGAVFIVYQEKHNSNWLVEIRNSVFTDFVSSTDALEAPPAELIKSGYLVDSPAKIAEWKQRLDQLPVYHNLLLRLSEAPSTIEKAKRIVLSFSRDGGRTFDRSADLTYKLTHISDPMGVCSDHVEVFQAVANVAGIDTVEFDSGLHNTCNFYCPELSKWVWIDPQFALLAKNTSGEYLSVSELRSCYLRGERFNFEFFGLPQQECSHVSPQDLYMYQAANFGRQLTATWGSNVFAFDARRDRFLLLPKSFRQSVFLLLGMNAPYRSLDDGFPMAVQRHRTRATFMVIIWTLALGTLLYPLYLLVTMMVRWARGLAAHELSPDRSESEIVPTP